MTTNKDACFKLLLSMIYLACTIPVHGELMGLRPTRFYNFKISAMQITKLCETKKIVLVNNMFPGPEIYAREGERMVVKVSNESPYNATIHWHGVRQMLSCWHDGPSYITQCPIRTGHSFTYKFVLLKQRGTFFWHAHVSWLRATVHGALIVYPMPGFSYPFGQPYEEHTIILGEYWLEDVVKLQRRIITTGASSPPADAYMINGHPGPNYKCSDTDIYALSVVSGRIYMLRVINAGLNTEFFFAIANHTLTIVEADGEYTKPFSTDRVMVAPGQTMNILVTTDQPPATYSIAMGAYMSSFQIPFQNTTSIGRFQYICNHRGTMCLHNFSVPASLPRFNDNSTVMKILEGIKGREVLRVPRVIDKSFFITIGLNINKCRSNAPQKYCLATGNGTLAASMNNISFVFPPVSILEAYHHGINGYFTKDFPETPLQIFDFVHDAPNNPPNNTNSVRGTRVIVVEYGRRVEMIFQNTGTITVENHPIHLHGYSFYVVGFGLGNYNPHTTDLNLIDPPYMNTIGVPVGGWAAIRFVADNPGVWFMHCHFDEHQSWGLATVLIVQNGKGPQARLPPPPPNLPPC